MVGQPVLRVPRLAQQGENVLPLLGRAKPQKASSTKSSRERYRRNGGVLEIMASPDPIARCLYREGAPDGGACLHPNHAALRPARGSRHARRFGRSDSTSFSSMASLAALGPATSRHDVEVLTSTTQNVYGFSRALICSSNHTNSFGNIAMRGAAALSLLMMSRPLRKAASACARSPCWASTIATRP